MDQIQNASIQYHYAPQTGELVEGFDPSGVQPVGAMTGIIDSRQVIYTTSDGDGQLQVYHHDGSQAIQGLEGQDTIVFLDEGMEVETETEVATASEAIEAVKYIEEGGDQMQKFIIQMAPQDQEVRQEPQRIIIPGLENYVVQLDEQAHRPENIRHFQSIQPRSVYPKIAIKAIEKPMRSQPLILKPPQIAQQAAPQPVKPEATVISKSETTLPAKVVIDSKQVKHHKKYPTAQSENTEYIYVTRTLTSHKDDSQDVGKSVYNTIKVSRPPLKQVDTKSTPEATVPVMSHVEGSSSQPGSSQQVASPELNQETAPALIQMMPPVSKQVTSMSQLVAATSQQVATTPQQVATTPPQHVAKASQQVATLSQQVATTSQQVATASQQVAASSQQVAAISQKVAAAMVPVQASEIDSRTSSQQLQSLIKPQNKGPRMVSVLGASRNIVRKDGSVFPVDPVSKKIIFVPLSADEAKEAVSLDESSKDVNSDDEASDVSDEEQEPLAKKARPKYETLERETEGKWKGKWKKKPNYKNPKPKRHLSPKDVAPPPKQPAKYKKRDKSHSKSMETVTLDTNIVIKKEVEEGENVTLQKQKKKDEDELEEELEEKKCRMCLALHNAECPLMRRRVRLNINDNMSCLNSTMLSLKSLPKEFVLSSRDGHGLSVFASDVIEKGTHFGPLVGEQLTFEQISHKMDFTHLWLIETEETISAVDKKIIKYNFINTGNEMTSNWCRYLRPTLNAQECNLISYCKNEEIWFVAREDIQEGEEMIMYFRFIEDLHNELWFADLCNRTQKLCKRCDVVYTNLVSYVKHVQVFHPYSLKKLKAICKECGLVLESTGELTEHCKEAHQGNGAFVCKDCGKQFPIPRGLQQHRKFFHIVEGNFACEHCGKCFFNKFKLRNHMRNKHSGKEFRCEVCKKVVGSRNALNRHRKSHTEEGYKFTCDRCGKSCRDNSNLRSHMITHIKARQFPCTVAGCLMRYGSKVALQMHFAKTHLLSPEQIKVHMLSIINTEKQDGDELQQEVVTARVMSGTQTEIIYDLESEDEDDFIDC
ncbi:uncharacterized protein LOC110461369 [Mizuhopecten yessoensis]|uniref:uncharacterized protein LOC110461369 n=1 Tax=Mizuhopecten yessoensis TaxID=6573 RepID=UPI000B45B86E|nr:uncharacterized protein LOC110461369 [Mizuhopecten yessoensis]XP_021370493.1 uncharacterized protein LOC110461369 [Mizuhopecten yessoensis]